MSGVPERAGVGMFWKVTPGLCVPPIDGRFVCDDVSDPGKANATPAGLSDLEPAGNATGPSSAVVWAQQPDDIGLQSQSQNGGEADQFHLYKKKA